MDGVLNVGDIVQVKLLEVDKQGKLKLSRKALLPRPDRTEDSKPASE
jgi:polyribonucleotide nucleotidyltransferase